MNTALYMVPVPISEAPLEDALPPFNKEVVKCLKYYIVENVRTARRFLKKIDPSIDISSLTFYELNGHTPENEISGYLEPLRKGESVGVMSEAGCPGVADPGAKAVEIAQNEGLRVIPLVGPSSILLALMASGFNGQKFSFHGYLPVKDAERETAIRQLEAHSRKENTTQIFIETPYRNDKMLASLLKILKGETKLCVASGIQSPENEKIITRPVAEWKKEKIDIGKVPAIFLIGS